MEARSLRLDAVEPRAATVCGGSGDRRLDAVEPRVPAGCGGWGNPQLRPNLIARRLGSAPSDPADGLDPAKAWPPENPSNLSRAPTLRDPDIPLRDPFMVIYW